MLTPPSRARERILLTGPWGAGKSHAWCTVAAWSRRTKSEARFYVVDTDHAVDRLAEGYDNFFENVEHRDVYEWPEYIDAMEAFGKVATENDFLIVDLADKAWSAVQDWYIEQVYGKNSASFFLEWKKGSDKGGSPLADGFGTNWQVINKNYNPFIQRVVRWPGHVIACTPAEPVRQPDRSGKGGDSKDVLDAFGKYGVKPAGQKALGFQFFTVILLNPMGEEQWRYTSMKDVNRSRPQNEPLKDFVMDYLVGVAGWTL